MIDVAEKPEEPQVLEMRIVAEIGKPMIVHFPALGDKLITYGFLKMAEKVIDAHYKSLDNKKIMPVKGDMFNFVRNK